MFPIIVGFGSALLFGLFAFGTYGLEGASGSNWVWMVLFALVLSALLVFLLDRKLPCWVCHLNKILRNHERLCSSC